MATAVDAALAEVQATLAALGPPREGWKDNRRLNIQPESVPYVEAAVELFDRYWDTLKAAEAALLAISGTPVIYPEIPVIELPPAVYADILDQRTTVDAAFATAKSTNPATTMGLKAGAPGPK